MIFTVGTFDDCLGAIGAGNEAAMLLYSLFTGKSPRSSDLVSRAIAGQLRQVCGNGGTFATGLPSRCSEPSFNSSSLFSSRRLSSHQANPILVASSPSAGFTPSGADSAA